MQINGLLSANISIDLNKCTYNIQGNTKYIFLTFLDGYNSVILIQKNEYALISTVSKMFSINTYVMQVWLFAEIDL